MINQSKRIKAAKAKNTIRTRTFRSNLSPQQRDAARKKDRIRKAKIRQAKGAEETSRARENDRIRKAESRKSKGTQEVQKEISENCEQTKEDELLSDETIAKSKAEALKYLHRTQVGHTNWHQAHVCVICDCFIIGTETVKRLKGKQLKVHEERLGVQSYKEFYNLRDLPEDLRNYYKLKGFPSMLLSPRSNKTNKGFSCCSTCHEGMRASNKDKKPPKLSIANGFVIGEFPRLTYTDDQGMEHEFDVESDLTDVMRALLAPTRTHGYVMAFTGGKHKSIMGHYQFFEMDQTKLGGALNYIRHNEKRQHVYCMLSGRMTPNQKKIATKNCMVDTNLYTVLSEWFIKKSGHRGFTTVPIPDECPQPVIIVDEETQNNTDQSAKPDVEDRFVGGSYYFSSAQDPNPDNSVYENSNNFTVAMLKQTTPTLLVYGGKYANMVELDLENLLPFAFPYGVGTPKQKRPHHVSFQACIQRYMRLAMRQFMRGDVILVMNHIYMAVNNRTKVV